MKATLFVKHSHRRLANPFPDLFCHGVGRVLVRQGRLEYGTSMCLRNLRFLDINVQQQRLEVCMTLPVRFCLQVRLKRTLHHGGCLRAPRGWTSR